MQPSSILVELEFADVSFCGGRRNGKPGEKPLEQDENPPKTGIMSWPHWWMASAVTAAPSMLKDSYLLSHYFFARCKIFQVGVTLKMSVGRRTPERVKY